MASSSDDGVPARAPTGRRPRSKSEVAPASAMLAAPREGRGPQRASADLPSPRAARWAQQPVGHSSDSDGPDARRPRASPAKVRLAGVIRPRTRQGTALWACAGWSVTRPALRCPLTASAADSVSCRPKLPGVQAPAQLRGKASQPGPADLQPRAHAAPGRPSVQRSLSTQSKREQSGDDDDVLTPRAHGPRSGAAPGVQVQVQALRRTGSLTIRPCSRV